MEERIGRDEGRGQRRERNGRTHVQHFFSDVPEAVVDFYGVHAKDTGHEGERKL